MNDWLNWVAPQDRWLFWVIAFNVLLFSTVFIAIMIYRSYYILTHKRERKFRSTLLSLLSGALNYPEREQHYAAKIKKLVRRTWQVEILLDNLVVMCYSFSGVYEARSKALYDLFNLREISQRKLKSRQWHEIVEGIIELSIVGGSNDVKAILPLLEHENFHVRKEAKIAIVEIGEVRGLMEMEARMGLMSRWTFISILSILHRSAFKLKKEELEKLKNSDNPAMLRLTQHLEKFSVAS
ncbi:hypothetical protein [Marinoscillum sp. MHG1-6]|uniref:hypothetical protein n=1 Tax=Marinoscillum sp. MHG1-6 TaxID=2959627 RepID=UPI00215860F1|nr:hypothetical protein [Marinoscillum sp. MHG1-6]